MLRKVNSDIFGFGQRSKGKNQNLLEILLMDSDSEDDVDNVHNSGLFPPTKVILEILMEKLLTSSMEHHVQIYFVCFGNHGRIQN